MTPSNLETQGATGARAWLTKYRLSIAKLLFMTITTVLVLYFQINRPKVPLSYHTKDPHDSVRGGRQYICGCTLPTYLDRDLEPALPASEVSESSVPLEGCYHSSALQTARILTYPNFTGAEDLDNTVKMLNSTKDPVKREFRGLHRDMQAHGMYWPDGSFFGDFAALLNDLFPGGVGSRQPRISKAIGYLSNSNRFTNFPASYLQVAFLFKCTDCESCSLDKVNEIFTKFSASDEPWGNCVLWGAEDKCRDESYYQAKCEMYPIAGVPLNFAIQRFLHDFQLLKGIDQQNITPPWPENLREPGEASYDANVLYMNLPSVKEGSVNLSFVELEKGSTAWLMPRLSYPSLDTECSDMANVTICNGTSICNLFKTDGGDGHDLRCLEMNNKTRCLDLPQSGVRIDDAKNLWGEFAIGTDNRWSDLMCMSYSCKSERPYLVVGQTAPTMLQHSSLNNYLESKKLRKFWDENSGVCTKTYSKVLRITDPESNQTMFLEANCASSPDDSEADAYCWLTGYYHFLTDLPGSDWIKLNSSSLQIPEYRFVCYYVEDQAFIVWLIVSFGILFGWIGTVELLFQWFQTTVAKLTTKVQAYTRKYRILRRTPTGEESVLSNEVTEEVDNVINEREKYRGMISSLSSRALQLGNMPPLAYPPTYQRLEST